MPKKTLIQGMLRLAAILILTSWAGICYSQTPDSTTNIFGVDSLGERLSLDSVELKQREKLDSIKLSTEQTFNKIKDSYDSINRAAGQATIKLQHSIDSLTNLQLPSNHLTQKLDSIRMWKDSKLAPITKKASELQSKTVEKINSLDLPPELKKEAQQVTAAVQKLNVTLPKSEIPGLSSLNVPSLGVPKVGNPLGGQSLPGVPGVDAKLPSTGLGDAGKEVQQVQQQASQYIPKSADDIPKTLEQQAGKVGEMKAVNQELGKAGQMTNGLTPGQDPEAMKKQMMQKAKEAAVDHFAGKEQQLQEAMQKIAKYKQKYSSVQSLADLPKKRPNEMKGKPFIERFVPGVAFQIFRKDDYLVDINAYAGYRLTGRLTTGAGWNQRAGYSPHHHHIQTLYGPRLFGEFKLAKGFSGRLETEWMNTRVPPQFSSRPQDPSSRQWVFGVLGGMKKDYRFFKNIKGTTMLFYNFYNPNHRSPYLDRVNVRFGFEFPMKKKTKTSKQK